MIVGNELDLEAVTVREESGVVVRTARVWVQVGKGAPIRVGAIPKLTGRKRTDSRNGTRDG